MSKSTVIKSYKTKKKYKYDSERMRRKGYEIEHEMLIVGELQVEYFKAERKDELMDNKIKNAINEIEAEINNEKACILRGEITAARMQYVTGLEVALNIVKKHCIQ
jgi:hypothetical protein